MDIEDTLLMIPGPVKVAPRVLRAMSKPMISHRSGEFGAIYSECAELLKEFFQTKNQIAIMTGSGTLGMDAAVAGIIGHEDKIVTISNGKFGERFTEIGERYGKCVPVKFDWGTPFDLDRVEAALEEGAKAVTMVHNETSVGLTNPAKEVGKLAKKHDAVFIVDGISSIGGNEFLTDDWNIDIAITGSQKALAVPPGLAVVSVSPRAEERFLAQSASYYADLKAHLIRLVAQASAYAPASRCFRRRRGPARASGRGRARAEPAAGNRHRRSHDPPRPVRPGRRRRNRGCREKRCAWARFRRLKPRGKATVGTLALGDRYLADTTPGARPCVPP